MFASAAASVDDNLAQREKDVLKSLADGNSYKMVAAELPVSIDTVRTHSHGI